MTYSPGSFNGILNGIQSVNKDYRKPETVKKEKTKHKMIFNRFTLIKSYKVLLTACNTTANTGCCR